MTRPQQHSNAIIARLAALAVVSILLASITAHAQTFTVLHEFTGGADGSNPYSEPGDGSQRKSVWRRTLWRSAEL